MKIKESIKIKSFVRIIDLKIFYNIDYKRELFDTGKKKPYKTIISGIVLSEKGLKILKKELVKHGKRSTQRQKA